MDATPRPHTVRHGRRVLAAAIGAAAALGATAGGVGAATAPPDRPTDASLPSSPATVEYPIEVEHQLGTITIPEQPDRVVAMTGRDVDTLLALGVMPVGIHSIYDFESGVGPWATEALGDATPEVWLGREFNYEAIAATNPDLIVYANAGDDRQIYDQLSAIAPTVALPLGAVPYGASTEDSTMLIAEALGRRDDGQRLLAELDSYYDEQAATYPSFAGHTVNYLDIYPGGISSYSRDHVVNAVMYEVGFDPIAPSDLPDGESSVEVSSERLAEFDADIVLAYPFGRSIEEIAVEIPTMTTLDSYANGRFFVLADLALSNSSVLSIPYALDNLLPQIDAALTDG